MMRRCALFTLFRFKMLELIGIYQKPICLHPIGIQHAGKCQTFQLLFSLNSVI